MPASDDPFDDPGWKAYVTHVQHELIPMIDASGVTISLAPKDPKQVDVKFALELGLSIMLDKPIIVVIDADAVLPKGLEAVATIVVRGELDDPATKAMLTQGIAAVIADLDAKEDH
jgi:hypothetical protein